MTVESKRKMFGVASKTNQTISNTLRAMNNPGAAFTPIDLDRIDPDPENPRWLEFDREHPRAIAEDDPWREEKLKEIELIENMALSIASMGVVTPINVYRVGDRFRIAQGDRRFRASILAGKSSIPALVQKECPDSLRLQQFIENDQRKGLPFRLKVLNLEAVIAEAKAKGNDIDSADLLRDLTGLGRTQAFDYMTVLQSTSDVRTAIASGKLPGLAQAAKIARITDPQEREEAIEQAASDTPKLATTPRNGKPRGGRPATYVRLGKTMHTDIARRLIEGVVGKERFKDTDWTSLDAVAAVFKRLITEMESGEI